MEEAEEEILLERRESSVSLVCPVMFDAFAGPARSIVAGGESRKASGDFVRNSSGEYKYSARRTGASSVTKIQVGSQLNGADQVITQSVDQFFIENRQLAVNSVEIVHKT